MLTTIATPSRRSSNRSVITNPLFSRILRAWYYQGQYCRVARLNNSMGVIRVSMSRGSRPAGFATSFLQVIRLN
jgi:hypothetical protein